MALCPSDLRRPNARCRCKFRPPGASRQRSSGESSRSCAGNSAISHTVPFAACHRLFRPPATSHLSSGDSARGSATAAFHEAPLQQPLCWHTAASLRRLFSWHITTSFQRPLLSPGLLFPWFTLLTGSYSASAVRLLLSQGVWYRRPPLSASMFLAGVPGPPAPTRGSARWWSSHPLTGLHLFPRFPGRFWFQLQPPASSVPGFPFRIPPPHHRWHPSPHLGNPRNFGPFRLSSFPFFFSFGPRLSSHPRC